MSTATAPAPVRASTHADRSESALPQVVPGTTYNQQLVERFHREVGNVVNSRVLPLASGEVLVKTLYGFYMVVPTWNLDVATGVIREGVIEPWTNEVALSLLNEGNGFVNVGANFGYYSVLAAQKVGRSGKVYSIEANPVVFKYLAKTLYWSGYPDVIEAYNCAAASPDMNGKPIGFFFDPQFIGGGNMFSDGRVFSDNANDCLWTDQNIHMTLDENRKFCIGGIFSRIETVGKTVDSIVPAQQKINAMLIDAEGSECFVIGGSKEMIRRNPNMSIILEWAPHNYECDPARRPSMDAMWDFLLGEMKYQVLRICPENYAGFGAMPKLERLTREQLMRIPHSDLLLRRG